MMKFSGYTPVWKIIVFSILSAGLYLFPWYYKNRQFLMSELKYYKNVTVDTVLLAIPVVNLAMLYDQQDLTNEFIKKNKKQADVKPATIVGVLILLSFLTWLIPYMVIFVFVVPLTMQKELNKAIKDKQYVFCTVGEALSLLVGVACWIYFIL